MFRNPERCILINGEITSEVANGVMADLLKMEADRDGGDVTVRITSPGGETSCGLALFDAFRLSPLKIITEAFGEVYSAAFLIFQGGHRRRVAPYARLMWHDGSANFTGPVSQRDVRAAAREMKQLDDICNIAVAKRMGVDVELVEGWSHAETYWAATEAVKDKVADEVIS